MVSFVAVLEHKKMAPATREKFVDLFFFAHKIAPSPLVAARVRTRKYRRLQAQELCATRVHCIL